MNDFGLNVRFMPHALEGIEYVKNHPEKRAADLLQALSDPEIDMILCAIGGDDTYRLLPFLFEHNELADAVSDKVFLGFSDTTINHFMLHKVGMKTFYGQSFLADVCELDKDTRLSVFMPGAEDVLPFETDLSLQSHETLQFASVDEGQLRTYAPDLSEEDKQSLNLSLIHI